MRSRGRKQNFDELGALTPPESHSREAEQKFIASARPDDGAAYLSRLKEWLRRFHGVARKSFPSYLGWSQTLEVLGQKATPPALGPYPRIAL